MFVRSIPEVSFHVFPPTCPLPSTTQAACRSHRRVGSRQTHAQVVAARPALFADPTVSETFRETADATIFTSTESFTVVDRTAAAIPQVRRFTPRSIRLNQLTSRQRQAFDAHKASLPSNPTAIHYKRQRLAVFQGPVARRIPARTPTTPSWSHRASHPRRSSSPEPEKHDAPVGPVRAALATHPFGDRQNDRLDLVGSSGWDAVERRRIWNGSQSAP